MYRGSPTYTKITFRVSTTTVFGLCTCKWGIFTLVGDPLQSHLQEFHVTWFFLCSKMHVRQGLSVEDIKTHARTFQHFFSYNRKILTLGIIRGSRLKSRATVLARRCSQHLYYIIIQGLLYLDGRNSQKYLHQDQANF